MTRIYFFDIDGDGDLDLVCAYDGGGLVWMNEDTTLTFDSCSVTANTGGGVHIDDDFPTFFHSIDSDWGTGVDDNDPFDVAIYEDLTYTAYGGNETFTCNVTNGCH